ncbi:M13 family metallopeptidase [Alkalimonas collagenimarina]|uniref:M13 family metallopeptidase n=1 Tax=Alkalimonas collagenimarina TaxID=400390 RepID=A0ABT9GYM1_9GAMM|nr:M13 family metallopeptidase [Alkalimonas collagenimarina]MDP4536160.1 M13 family metallopeptidase [Alkalimonas collagenimarina]
MKKVSLLAVSVAMALGLAACDSNSGRPGQQEQVASEMTAQSALSSGVDVENFDSSVRLQDDFYLAVNGKWIENNPIPADKSRIGSFDILADQAQLAVKTIIEEVAASDNLQPGSDADKLASFYNSFMDIERINQLGLTPIQAQLQRIEQLESKAELGQAVAELQRDGVGGVFGWYVNNDARESTQYAVYLFQGGLGLPDRDYYFNEDDDSLRIKAAYQDYVADMLALAGHDDAAVAAEHILALEHALAEHHWTRLESRNADKTYNKLSADDVIELMGSFDWAGYGSTMGLPAGQDIIVAQPSYFSGLSEVIDATELSTLQAYLTYRTVHSFAPQLSQNFVDRRFAFYSQTLQGVEEQQPRWKRAVDTTNGVLGELVGKLYVERHFNEDAKARMEALVDNLIKAYGESIKELPWMSDDTKVAALEKLSTFTTKIGYPDQWKDYSDLEIKADDLIGNSIRANHRAYQEMVDKLGGPIQQHEWFMTPQTVNAYYNPVMNEIVFPAAILQPPFFDMEADDAVNYGGIGAVIGHEIGHGFDDQGAKYDGDGNLRDWWTAEDLAQFQQLGARLSAQYSQFEPFPGVFVDGDVALGENIGDLGGMTVALRAYKMSLDGEEAPVLDGFSGLQRFFIGWAQIWRSNYREEALRRQVSTGPHSPPHYRVIGVLPNIPEFYQAFDVQPGDEMYLAEEERVKIW